MPCCVHPDPTATPGSPTRTGVTRDALISPGCGPGTPGCPQRVSGPGGPTRGACPTPIGSGQDQGPAGRSLPGPGPAGLCATCERAEERAPQALGSRRSTRVRCHSCDPAQPVPLCHRSTRPSLVPLAVTLSSATAPGDGPKAGGACSPAAMYGSVVYLAAEEGRVEPLGEARGTAWPRHCPPPALSLPPP